MKRNWTRRGLLMSAAATVAPRWSEAQSEGRPGRMFAYVGTYTPNGRGIHIFEMNVSNGRLKPLKVLEMNNSPAWLAVDAKHEFLYSANEGGGKGTISAFAVDRATGDLKLLNSVSSGGAGPAHASVDPRGEFVFAANYGGGSVAVIPRRADGTLSEPVQVIETPSVCSPPCKPGAKKPAKAAPGSFAFSGHDGPHAHMIECDPSGEYVIAQELGLDLTIVWKLDRVSRRLSLHQTIPSTAGAGPRHFVFHPNGRVFYSLNEESSTLVTMTWDPASGRLAPVDEISTLPAGFEGTSFTAELALSADGRFLYCCNRLHNSITTFEIGASGRVRPAGETWTRGDYPRHIGLDPTGRFLYACHNRSDNVTVFYVNKEDGQLQFTGQYAGVGSAAMIAFLKTDQVSGASF